MRVEITTNMDGHKKKNKSKFKEINHQVVFDLGTPHHRRLENHLEDHKLTYKLDN